MGYTVVQPQCLSNARVIEVMDYCNAFSEACGLWAWGMVCSDNNIHSIDATNFEVSCEGKYHCVLKPGKDDSSYIKNIDIPTTVKNKNALSMFIKYLYCGSCAGKAAPIVLLCAWKQLLQDAFYHYPLMHLQASITPNSPPGHLCFTQSRAGNLVLWHWYFRDVSIPYLEACRGTEGHSDL